jgi:DNA primase
MGQNSPVANPGDFAYNVKQQADIVRIVGEYVKLRKSGAQNYSGLCPFHGEKTPSFSVHASRQYFHCFGCGVSGDVFTFVQKIENITFPEAVRAVAQKLGIAAPKAEFSSPQEAREARTRGLLLDLHEAACLWFQQQLARPEAASAREYLHPRTRRRSHRALPHRLRPRIRLSAPRQTQASRRRRRPARKRPLQLEGERRRARIPKG